MELGSASQCQCHTLKSGVYNAGKELCTKVFCADSYSSWQKGAIEALPMILFMLCS